MEDYIIVAGGINVDIKGKSLDTIVLESSNPGIIELSAGGVGRNIAHNLALLNVPVVLLSAVGSDPQGLKVLEETAMSGVCTEYVLSSENDITGTYIALLDKSGEMALGLSDMKVLERLDIEYFKSKIDLLRNSSFIVCDTNIPTASIDFLKKAANTFGIPICVEPVSVSKTMKLKGYLSGIDYITPNLDELVALSGYEDAESNVPKAAEELLYLGVKNVITTLGRQGLCYSSPEGSTYYDIIKAPLTDVTGAGDSLTAGFIYGMLKYNDIDKALKCGLAAASITISSKETVAPEMSERAIKAALLRYSAQQLQRALEASK